MSLAKEDKTVAIDYFNYVPELLGMETISSELIYDSINEIQESLKDHTLIHTLAEKAIGRLFDENEEMQKIAIRILAQIKEPEKLTGKNNLGKYSENTL